MGSNSTNVPSDFLAQVELKDTAVKNYDAKNEKMTNKKEEEEDYQMEAKSDQAQKLQTDTQAEHDDR